LFANEKSLRISQRIGQFEFGQWSQRVAGVLQWKSGEFGRQNDRRGAE